MRNTLSGFFQGWCAYRFFNYFCQLYVSMNKRERVNKVPMNKTLSKTGFILALGSVTISVNHVPKSCPFPGTYPRVGQTFRTSVTFF